MSNSLDSPGLCLSSNNTSCVTTTDETGEAGNIRSVSIESLSLTKISAANTNQLHSDLQPPVLIKLPGHTSTKYYTTDQAPQLISLTGQQSASTSGITPSASTLEGTLDDIPDFQDIAPLTAVVINKKARDTASDEDDKGSPAKSGPEGGNTQYSSPPSHFKTSPPSKSGFMLTSESRFMQEVKQLSKARQTGSVKSFASTTAPKTSTSGVTVVEVKPARNTTRSNQSNQRENQLSDKSYNKSDTMQIDELSMSTDYDESVHISSMSIFKSFQPKVPKLKRPFLLQMPSDDEFNNRNEQETEQAEHNTNYTTKPDVSDKDNRIVLSNKTSCSIMNNTKVGKTKSWKNMHDTSRSRLNVSGEKSAGEISGENSNNSSEVLYADKQNRKHRKREVVNYMGPNGIKQIVKEEMNAVVTMQNDIWHKILDSFMEKSSNGGHPTASGDNMGQPTAPLLRQPRPPPREMVMLQLPREPDDCYKPMKIPILKPFKDLRVPLMLKFPDEDEKKTTKSPDCSSEREATNSNETDIEETNEKGASEDRSNIPSRGDTKMAESNDKANEVNNKHLHPMKEPVVTHASVQTSLPVKKPQAKMVNVSIQPEEPLQGPDCVPKTVKLLKPLSQNVEYQQVVNEHQLPLKAIEECKLLLESIQNSAQELQAMKKDMISDTKHKPYLEEDNVMSVPKPHQSFIRTKHELFLEEFFDKLAPQKHKSPKAYNKFLDVVDLSYKPNEQGHFAINKSSKAPAEMQPKKPKSQFIHSSDIIKPGNTYNMKSGAPTKQESDSPPIQLNTAEIFSPKKEISRSPVSSQKLSPQSEVPSDRNLETPESCKLEAQKSPVRNQHLSQRSDTLSPIDRYLSDIDPDCSSSDSDKTITQPQDLGDHISSKSTTPVQSEGSVARVPHTPHVTDKVLHQPKSPPSQPKDPTALCQYLSENISAIKQSYSEAEKAELARNNRINMLLRSRNPTPLKTSNTFNILKSPPIHVPNTDITPGKVDTGKSKPVQPSDVKKSAEEVGEVSVCSSGTSSLPTNTEDLIAAALRDSGSTILTKHGVAKQRVTKPYVNKQHVPGAGQPEKKELKVWMDENRKRRTAQYKREREDKIQREARPYKRILSNQSPVKRVPEYDRKAAILRRLQSAEALFNDIQHTPAAAGKQEKRGPDRTAEWVQGLNSEEFDSIHSPSLAGSAHGASQITDNISLP